MDCLVCGFSHLFLITTCSFIEETKQRIADEVCVGYLFNRLNVRLCLLHNQQFFPLDPSFLSPGDTHGSQKGRMIYSSCQPEVLDLFFFF